MKYLRRLPSFQYIVPKTLGEVCSLLSEHKGEAKLVAGGTDLLSLMKMREVVPQYLIGLKNVPGLDYIEYDESAGLRLGALTTLHSLESSPLIKEKCNILAQAAYSMASVEIRNVGTIGGNLCQASPSADTAPPLIALGARLKLVSAARERVIPVEEFFKGPGETVLGTSELLAEIQVPNPPPHSGGVYLKHTLRGAMDLAIVGVAVIIALDSADGICKDARIALGAVAPTPIRARKAEEVLTGKALETGLIEQASQVASEEAHPITDIRSSAEYRTEMIRVLTKRAVTQAWEKARAS